MKRTLRGRVVAAHGRHYVVRDDGDRAVVCFTRGKRSEAACGDVVDFEETGDEQGVIVGIAERRNLLARSNAFRTKRLAANVDAVAIVVAVAPPFSEELLGRAIVAAESIDVPARILLNKVDLVDRASHARDALSLYASLGYAVEELSVKHAPDAVVATLAPTMTGRSTLLMGQSGMGKSSLLNLMVPDAQAATRDISEALQTGKHTTTDARLYRLPATVDPAREGALIDTPGFQEFGLSHLTPGTIERAFPELRPSLGRCRFANCMHLHEPGCAVREAVDAGAIAQRRYELFTRLTTESSGFRAR